MVSAKYIARSIIGNRLVDDELLATCNHHELTLSEIAPFLLRGADVNAVAVRYAAGSDRPFNRSTPLSLVCSHSGNVDVVAELLDRGARAEVDAGQGWTPLMHAAHDCRAKLINLLLDHGANPHARSRSGQTPLHRAAGGLNADVVCILLERRVEVEALAGC